MHSLVAAGLPQEEIGVLAMYRQQIKLLVSTLQEDASSVEMLTADQSQGRDKECILISLTRSNKEGKVSCHLVNDWFGHITNLHEQQVGDLLQDWRRLNVCLTRAKSKLVLFGSRSTLQDVLADLFGLLEEKSWIYRLAEDANINHCLSNKRKSTISSHVEKNARLRILFPLDPNFEIDA